MSATAQTNGKKSSNSSTVNTPASTPVTNGNSQTISQSTPPPPNNNAPKYGTLVPNRIFVGGISANTTEGELLQLFSHYGTVKAAKIIQDRAGVSKGYGFITFESEDDAKRPLKDADNIVLRERKLNIAPAIKKQVRLPPCRSFDSIDFDLQPFNRAFDASSPSTVAPGNTAQYFFPPSAGVPYFQGGVTYYQQPPTAPGDPNSQPTTVYQAPPVYSAQTGPPQAPTYPSMMFPPPIYMPQQYAMPPMPYDFNYYPNNGGPQYMVGGQNGPAGGTAASAAGTSQGPPMPPPNSPPRPPCYNSQLPYPADPVYYNVPVYGGPLEGAPVYPEGLDMANGVYPEVSQILSDFLSSFGFDGADAQGSFPPMGEPAAPELDLQVEPPPFDRAPPPPPPPLETPADPDASRQSKTPVVSLLSMEQHQEKDFVSMQGGRRVKPQPPPPPPPIAVPHFHHQPPLFNPFNFNGPPVRSQQPYKTANSARETMSNNNINNNSSNNNNNGWRKRNYNPTRKSYDRNNDSSSRSSMRTDSNSSANAAVVDENKNEEKGHGMPHHLSAIMPPPIGHHHHHHHPNYHLFNGTRTYQNSVGRRNHQGRSKDAPAAPPPAPPPLQQVNSKSNFVVPSQQMRNNNGQQSFVMSAARSRNKRSTRRHVQAGGSLSEIGAGDAPLPNNDVTDTCKKLETLKM
ncbi:atrophin-1 [Asbolus verrucosus]|uniref:Atrophin-1 n=1 Tax=Asbolus verrucosus TaxID=1661398 RepID=A0A482VND4_ASBVE|nr:atrophin-1 [Asbolus verrucosus]